MYLKVSENLEDKIALFLYNSKSWDLWPPKVQNDRFYLILS